MCFDARPSRVKNLKSVGGGVSEYVVNYGPGYRMYVGQDGSTLNHSLGR